MCVDNCGICEHPMCNHDMVDEQVTIAGIEKTFNCSQCEGKMCVKRTGLNFVLWFTEGSGVNE